MLHIGKKSILAGAIVILSIIAVTIYYLPFIPYRGLIFTFVYCPIVATMLICLGEYGLRQKRHQP